MSKGNFIRSTKVAFIVGRILNMINNYHVIIQCDFSFTNDAKIAFIYRFRSSFLFIQHGEL